MYECVRASVYCELKFGTCHQPLHGVEHEPLQLPTFSTPNGAQGGDQE